MYLFNLKELNFTRIRRWLIDAKSKQDTDPIFSFIATWICLNHFYGTLASTNLKDFSEWSKSNMSGNNGDKAQLMYSIQTREFVEFFDAFKSKQQKLFNIEIVLPIINLLNKQRVPDDLRGIYRLNDLQTSQIFQVFYQIRNNLFHGHKDPFSDERDKELSQIGNKFMLFLVSHLLLHTTGEVLDIYDNQQQEEIEIVQKIAEATND